MPIPGGVGYGMFYHASFRTQFSRGTSIYWEAVCPQNPGGNLASWLYVTATNRAAKGVEAFIAYDANKEAFFKVFDWARADHWQTNVSLARIDDYIGTGLYRGSSYRLLPIMNLTMQIEANAWKNQVWLFNRTSDRWELIYQFDYFTTPLDQQSGWVGSWGPIIETFQALIDGTERFGAIETKLSSLQPDGSWGDWRNLTSNDADLRSDKVGFDSLFLEPNHSWVVRS